MNCILEARKKDVTPAKIELTNLRNIVTDTNPFDNNAYSYYFFDYDSHFAIFSCRVSEYRIIIEA